MYETLMPVAIAGMLLLAVNLIFGTEKYGARNWISIGSFTMQPSEFVKVAFIFVGAATLEKYKHQKISFVSLYFQLYALVR